MSDATPTVPTAVQPAPAPPLKSGWKTTEFILTLLATLLAAFLNAGLLPDASPAVKIASMALAVLTTLGYTAARTALKSAASRSGLSLLLLLGLGMTQASCVMVKADASAVISCAGSTIGAQVAGIIQLVATALTGANVLGDVEDLVVKYGESIVACATRKLATPPAGAAVTNAAEQAAALIKLKGWHFAAVK